MYFVDDFSECYNSHIRMARPHEHIGFRYLPPKLTLGEKRPKQNRTKYGSVQDEGIQLLLNTIQLLNNYIFLSIFNNNSL